MGQSVLILVGTLLYPARRNGTTIRYYPLVRELRSRGYTVDLVVINKYHEPFSAGDIAHQESQCDRLDLIEVPEDGRALPAKLLRRVRNTLHRALPFGTPYEMLDNNRDYYLSRLRDLFIGRPRYDVAIGIDVGGNNADMLLSLGEDIRPGRVLCDFIDSAYLLRKRRQSAAGRLNPLSRFEERKLRARERSVSQRCTSIYITKTDAETVGSIDVSVIPNSVVEDGYAEAKTLELATPNIAFMGTMSYPPNDEAARYLVNVLFPLMKQRYPGLHLYIVGRNPSQALQADAAHPDIHVEGEVENIWDYIRSVDVCVFPMFSGAGQQNKVIEAMFAGKVVVTTPIANEGIDAEHGRHLYIANTSSEFVDYVGQSLEDGHAIQQNARGFVDEHYSEQSFVRKYLDVIDNGRVTA